MKIFLKYLSGLFMIISFYGILISLKEFRTEMFTEMYVQENEVLFFIFSLLFQFIIYFIIFICQFILFFKFRYFYSLELLKILGFAFCIQIFWQFFTFKIYYSPSHTQGQSYQSSHLFIWGPANTGLLFVSLSSIFINYFIFSLSFANKIITPLKLYLYYKDCEE
jgi:hypothetical protein